ncbi:MAG: RnfABCDGE type electron transport complex subunit C, partial [Gammaproteobacteria bacterium]|nr:RnfABCDGE type electron transport complex subunit C [Gammaproteobacteria bacterium]
MTLLLENPIPFRGGVHLTANKAQSLEIPLEKALIPPVLTIPLRQHIGTTAAPVVNTGERVLKGQQIARQQGFISAFIHASSSGTIVDIADHPVPSPSGQDAPCIVIETDGKDEWLPHEGIKDELFEISPVIIHDMIHASGIVGLGGAGFPSAIKMLPGLHYDIHLLVINASECEPYITCDEALMREHAREIVEGIKIIRHTVQAAECVIGIEDNKIEAITALQEEIKNLG